MVEQQINIAQCRWWLQSLFCPLTRGLPEDPVIIQSVHSTRPSTATFSQRALNRTSACIPIDAEHHVMARLVLDQIINSQHPDLQKAKLELQDFILQTKDIIQKHVEFVIKAIKQNYPTDLSDFTLYRLHYRGAMTFQQLQVQLKSKQYSAAAALA